VKRPPDGLGPIVPLDRRLAQPLHRQLYDGYREAILDGRLLPGQRLPSTRSLAQELQISRMPVVLAGPRPRTSSSLRPGPRHLPREPLPIAAEPWLDLRTRTRVRSVL
jgi:DNA-binding transcriptional MocR family regulator